MIKHSEPIFAVRDVRETIAFYREVLGFQSEWLWGNPPTFGGARWGPVHVMFNQMPDVASRVEGHQHWFGVEDADALHDRHVAAGATVVEPIGDRPWGVREYVVRDPNGYHLRFAGPVEYKRPAGGTDAPPDYMRVEIRTPTLDEYKALLAAVGWNKDESTMPAALAHSVCCAVATDTRDDRAIGMARACGDGRYYTIWDVMVLPEYQGRKIGAAVMTTLLARLRQIGPKGAYVGLFTGKQKFYHQFGFADSGGMSTSL
jgi:uncharacterized glyoxalase superfamily protein PhnB